MGGRREWERLLLHCSAGGDESTARTSGGEANREDVNGWHERNMDSMAGWQGARGLP